MSFDLDAAVAITAGEPFRFTWGGKPFELPRVLDLSIDRQLALVGAVDTIDATKAVPADLLNVFNLVLGEDLLKELSATKPLSAVGLIALLNAWMEFHGQDLGKSPASPASSARTARPSKQTSRSGQARKTS